MSERHEWEKRFDTLVRMYDLGINGRDRWNFTGLYIELDHESKRMIANGTMPEGTRYEIPFETGTPLALTCYSDSTQLDAVDGDKKLTLISRDASVQKEYRMLEAYTAGHKDYDGGAFYPGIGERFPESFYNMFVNDIEPGRILTFDTGNTCKSYVCTRKTLSTRKLKPLYSGDISKATIERFGKEKEREYTISDNDMQRLYREVKTASGSTHMHSINFDDKAQEEINKLYHTLEKGSRTAVLEIGNERIHVQKKIFGKDIRWFDKNGNRITEDDAKAYIAWVYSSPLQLNIKYKAKDTADEIDKFIKECAIREAYEESIAESRYFEAIKSLTDAAVRNQKDFKISFDSFVGSGRSTSFVLKVADDRCHISRVIRDADRETLSIEPVDISVFVSFCEERYKNFRMHEYDWQATSMYERYPNLNNTRERIIKEAAEKEADKATASFKEVDAKLDAIDPELDALVESYMPYSDNAKPKKITSHPSGNGDEEQSGNIAKTLDERIEEAKRQAESSNKGKKAPTSEDRSHDQER